MSFQYIKPTKEDVEIMQEYRVEFERLSAKIKFLMPSRGISLSLTKLEESAMWLNKAITKND